MILDTTWVTGASNMCRSYRKMTINGHWSFFYLICYIFVWVQHSFWFPASVKIGCGVLRMNIVILAINLSVQLEQFWRNVSTSKI